MSDKYHRIEVMDSGESFLCTELQSLLGGMEKQRLEAIAVGCRGGGCGICKIRILSGLYEAKKMSIKHVSSAEAAEGLALSCRVFPRGDMQIKAMITSAS